MESFEGSLGSLIGALTSDGLIGSARTHLITFRRSFAHSRLIGLHFYQNMPFFISYTVTSSIFHQFLSAHLMVTNTQRLQSFEIFLSSTFCCSSYCPHQWSWLTFLTSIRAKSKAVLLFAMRFPLFHFFFHINTY